MINEGLELGGDSRQQGENFEDTQSKYGQRSSPEGVLR